MRQSHMLSKSTPSNMPLFTRQRAKSVLPLLLAKASNHVTWINDVTVSPTYKSLLVYD